MHCNSIDFSEKGSKYHTLLLPCCSHTCHLAAVVRLDSLLAQNQERISVAAASKLLANIFWQLGDLGPSASTNKRDRKNPENMDDKGGQWTSVLVKANLPTLKHPQTIW